MTWLASVRKPAEAVIRADWASSGQSTETGIGVSVTVFHINDAAGFSHTTDGAELDDAANDGQIAVVAMANAIACGLTTYFLSFLVGFL
jgi:hypothetical protein